MKTKLKNDIKDEKVLEFENVSITFPTNDNTFFSAVENVSFHVSKKEIVGLVGESGSGKSTIGKSIVGVNSFVDGKIKINDFNLPNNTSNINRNLRKKITKSVQYIFQNPIGALNPTKTPKRAFIDAYTSNTSYKEVQFSKFEEVFKKYFNTNKLMKNFDENYKENIKEFDENMIIINDYISINSEFF
ncbi:MAG: ATP-binding cassette domain-containing protein, partial [Mycoplasmatales bacterium]|nr:ATP-binding cassette domain-containing protein [Mycoplasmatales bacterium]